MPRELGKAKRSDLTGHFPGEQAEYGSALARFLEGAGQMQPLEDGTYLDTPSGNGNGSSTEIPRNQTEVPTRGSDTEVAPAPRNGGNGTHGNNGSNSENDAGSDTLFDSEFADDAMIPEPAFEPEPMAPELLSPDTAELEPVTFEPSDATLHPDGDDLQTLDSVPDLTAPELDASDEEDESDEEDDTDILDRSSSLPTVTPEAHELAPADSSDTGMLIAEAFGTEPADRLTDADLNADGWDGLPAESSDDDRITDKLAPRPEGESVDEDLTSVWTEEREVDPEKITNKVEPKRDVDPREADPNAVVRDTVNFYNQTQSLHEQKEANGGFPTISPNVVNSAQPLDFQQTDFDSDNELSVADIFGDDDESETDTLQPGPAPSVEIEGPPDLDAQPELQTQAELDVQPELVAAPEFGSQPELEVEPEPAAVGSEDATRIVQPMSLEAESDIEVADKRETDKFKEDDRRPPPMPQPEGTDKIDKDQVAVEKAAAGVVQGLDPLVDEKVASGKDTQRFYVAEILAKKEEEPAGTGDTSAELQPAEEGPPTLATSSDTSPDYTAEPQAASTDTRRDERPAAEPKPLPVPTQVHTDFKYKVDERPSERIIPEIRSEVDAEEEFAAGFEPGPEYEPSLLNVAGDEDGDDTVDEEADEEAGEEAAAEASVEQPSVDSPAGRQDLEERKITEKVKRETEISKARDTDKYATVPAADQEPAMAAPAASERMKRITDSLSRRLKSEREETLQLIEQAEAIAVKLREASEQSRTDLVALSARRSVASSRADLPVTPVNVGTDLEELPKRMAPEVTPSVASETTGKSSKRQVANRVPTRAISEIISELEDSAKSAPVPLSELLDEVSAGQQVIDAETYDEPEPAPAVYDTPASDTAVDAADDEEEDIDIFVAASARWRTLVESDRYHDVEDEPELVAKHSRRHQARSVPLTEPEYEQESLREPAGEAAAATVSRATEAVTPERPVGVSSPLASDLDRLWEVLDSRRTATVVLPASDKPRVAPPEKELWEGWTQEMLWPTLAGIAGVTFALGALFVWVLMK